jgi:hypothetical protein
MQYGERTLYDQPCRTDRDILERIFRETRAIVRERASLAK